MARSNSITLSFPPFAGVVRSLVYANVTVFFAIAIARLFASARRQAARDGRVAVQRAADAVLALAVADEDRALQKSRLR